MSGIAFIAVLGQFAATMTYFGQMNPLTEVVQFRTIIKTYLALNAIIVFTDTFIAVTLICLLLRRPAAFKRTKSIINKLVVYTVGTSLVTTVWGLAGLIGAIAAPDSFMYLFMDIVFCKCE